MSLRGMAYIPGAYGSKTGSFGTVYESSLDEFGRYELKGIDVGQEYKILVTSAEGLPLTMELRIADFSPGENRTWDHVLCEPAIIRGHVYGENSSSLLTDVEVAYDKIGEEHYSTLLHSPEVRVDDRGTYEFKLLNMPGTFLFYPRYEGVPSIKRTMRELYGKEIELKGGEEITLDLILPDPWSMSVRIVDEDGNSVPNVRLLTRLEEGWYGLGGKTDKDGRFLFKGFVPEKSGWMVFEGNDEFVGGASTAQYVREAGEKAPDQTLVVFRRAEILGIAVDNKGVPIANASISISAYHAGHRTAVVRGRTDEEGIFQINGIPATEAILEVSLDLDNKEYTWTSELHVFETDFATDLGLVTFALKSETTDNESDS